MMCNVHDNSAKGFRLEKMLFGYKCEGSVALCHTNFNTRVTDRLM